MIIEAALIGLLCYLGALSSPWLLGLTGGWYLISRPLISGMLPQQRHLAAGDEFCAALCAYLYRRLFWRTVH